MDGHNQLFFNEHFLQHSFINHVKLGKNERKWRDFYNLYCRYGTLSRYGTLQNTVF
jgi:hypothetical protein